MTRLFCLGACVVVPGTPAVGLAAQPCPGPSQILPSDMLARARQVSTYPTFCSIPPTPTGVRGAKAFKSAVAQTRLAGANLVAQTAPPTFSLEDTEQFAAAARAQAAPPPPMTTPDEAAAEDFANTGRQRVTPPPRPR